MAKFKVHRVNLFRPKPTEINCMAYDDYSTKLSVVRSDFSIELWDMASNPFLERVIPSEQDSPIESVVWYKGRLFSSGLYGQIVEYDLNSLCPKHSYNASACAIWCLAVNEDKSLLAAGTEDGTVCIFQITSEGVDFVKNLYKHTGRIVSVAWHKSGDFIVAGSVNYIKIWNFVTGDVETINVASSLQKKETIVWCVAMTSDMTVISGDSCGKTSFWEAKTGTLLCASQAHNADVLTLCLTKDENTVYTSGVDPTIITFVKSQTESVFNHKTWLRSAQRILHTHDVKALQLTGNFLASGGVDTNLIFSRYPPKTVVKFSPFSQLSYCSVASEASLLLLRYPSELEVWKLGKTEAPLGDDGSLLPMSASPVKAVSLQSKSEQQIMCSAISADGKWLAYSTAAQLKLFHLNVESGVPYIQKVKSLPSSLEVAAHCLVFKPSEPRLVLSTAEGTIKILECDILSPKLLATSESVQGTAERKHLLVANKDFVACGDHKGTVTVYNANNLKIYCHLPLYKFQPTALQFDSTSENLVVVYSDRKLVEYNLKSKAYSPWSRQDSAAMGELQMSSYYPITGICCLPENNALLLYDENEIYTISQGLKGESPRKKRSKHADDSSFTIQEEKQIKRSDRYQNLLFFQTLRNDEAVVVEVPPHVIENSLPPALQKKRFGV